MRPLGKTVARPGSVKLHLASLVEPANLPSPPSGPFGHYTMVSPDYWGDLGNSTWGDCVWAGAAHEHMLWTRASGLPPAAFSEVDVLSDYSIVTGFSFSPDTDNGTDMQQAASYRRKTGILDASGQRHQIAAYMALRVGDFEQLMLAVWLFGAVGVGINFPGSAEKQFEDNAPWSVVMGSSIAGGHYIPVVGKSAAGNAVVITWGRTQEMTREFYQMYNDESIVYFSPEYTDLNKLSPEGFDMAALGQYLKELGS